MNRYDPFSTGVEETDYAFHTPRTKRSADDTPQWMLTIADLFSLILTFFVLLYSMSSMEQVKWEAISDSLQETSANIDVPGTTYTQTRKMLTVEQVTIGHARNLDYLWGIMNERFQKLAALDGITIVRERDRITLSLSTSDLFTGSGAEAKPQAATTFSSIAQFLGTIENAVTVEGYSSLKSVEGTGYPSNWELSLARAVVVANGLKLGGYDSDIEVFGKGSTTHKQAAGTGAKNLPDLGDRVDIVVRENLANY